MAYDATKPNQKYPKNVETDVKKSSFSIQHFISHKLQITQYNSLLSQVSIYHNIAKPKHGTAQY